MKFENNIIKPVADGETELKIEFGGRILTVPVKVENAAENGPFASLDDAHWPRAVVMLALARASSVRTDLRFPYSGLIPMVITIGLP